MIEFRYGDCKIKVIPLVFKYNTQYTIEFQNTSNRYIFYSNYEDRFVIGREFSDVINILLASEYFNCEQFEKNVEFEINDYGKLSIL